MINYAQRTQVIAAARHMEDRGLTQGTSGNVSVRFAEGMLITPSAVPYSTMEPSDLITMSLEGRVRGVPRGRLPSTEWRMHAGIFAHGPDIGAIIHAHPPWSTALSCLRRDIPPFHYMVAAAGGTVIRCSGYATFGTQELADAALQALGDRRACLLANHGIIACGNSLDAALRLAIEVEALAGQYMRALSVGEPALLTDAQMASVLEEFKTYGR
ncbi:MAG: class II aldolase/adducin family protein [Gemmatimonadota bacterium]|nr:class II aldolase/adducin family protein [Gemmatimonadota bacterium]MDH3427004.1 class II aldolase/adducin family protein [Gemmatimonadota bacterium]